MATRLYLQNAAAPITPAAWATGWGTPVTGNVTKNADTAKGATAFASLGAASSAVVSTLPFMRFVYGPIQAHTFGGTLKGQMRGQEGNAGAQCAAAIAVRILKPDGSERAVLHAPTYATTVDASPPELYTSLRNNKFRDGNANAYLDMAAVSALDGDYVVIEIGNRKNAASTTRTITFRYGDNDASNDLPENDTSTSDYCPWVEFTDTLAIYVEPSVVKYGTLFPTVENPLRETGLGDWLNGGTDAPAYWEDCRVSASGFCRAAQAGGVGYDDPTVMVGVAHAADHWAWGTVRNDIADAGQGEIEIHLRCTFGTGTIACYELLWPIANGMPANNPYLVRWNATDHPPNIYFDLLQEFSNLTLTTGMKIGGRVVGDTIYLYYFDGTPHLIGSYTDSSASKLTSGKPGIGFAYQEGGSYADYAEYGFTAFKSGEGPIEWTDPEPPAGDVTLYPGTGSLVLAGYAPAVKQTIRRFPGTGSLALTGYAPAVKQTIRAFPGTGSLALAGYAPTVKQTIRRSPGTGSLALTGYPPAVRQTIRLTPGTGSLGLTGYAPTVQISAVVRVEPGTGSLTLSGYAPAVHQTLRVFPGTGSLTLAAYAPAAVQTYRLHPGTGSLVLTGYTPAVRQTLRFTPGTGSLSLTGYAPEVRQTIRVQPGTGSLSLAGYAPTVSITAPVRVYPGTGSLALTGYAPTVQITGTVTVQPGTGSLALSGYAPVVRQIIRAYPGTGSLALTGHAPAVRLTIRLQPGTGSLGLVAHAPAVTLTLRVFPGTGSFALTGHAPTVQQVITLRPGTGSLALVGYAPTVRYVICVAPGTGALILSAYAPAIHQTIRVFPGTASLILTGYAPRLPGAVLAYADEQTVALATVEEGAVPLNDMRTVGLQITDEKTVPLGELP